MKNENFTYLFLNIMVFVTLLYTYLLLMRSGALFSSTTWKADVCQLNVYSFLSLVNENRQFTKMHTDTSDITNCNGRFFLFKKYHNVKVEKVITNFKILTGIHSFFPKIFNDVIVLKKIIRSCEFSSIIKIVCPLL